MIGAGVQYQLVILGFLDSKRYYSPVRNGGSGETGSCLFRCGHQSFSSSEFNIDFILEIVTGFQEASVTRRRILLVSYLCQVVLLYATD